MHIIGLIVAVLAFVGIWYWRVKAAANVASELGDAAGRLRGHVKRRMFRGKVEGATLTGISDPRLGAAVLLVSLVEAQRRLAPADEAAIATWLRDVAEDAAPEEALTFARWASREVVDVNDVVRRLTPLFKAELGLPERRQLLDMAATLLPADPDEAREPAQALKRLRAALLPDALPHRNT